MRKGQHIRLQDCGKELLSEMQEIALILDEQNNTQRYSLALKQQQERIEDAERTPSARVLREMRENKMCFFEYAKHLSKQHEKLLSDSDLSEKEVTMFQDSVRQSVEKQGQIEGYDTVSFDEFLQNYFSSKISEQDVTI